MDEIPLEDGKVFGEEVTGAPLAIPSLRGSSSVLTHGPHAA
jgi:hypothetical protein